MTRDTLRAMMKWMSGNWPGKLDSWRMEEVIPAWEKTLEPFTDEQVRLGFAKLLADPDRDQQWPPSAPEIAKFARTVQEQQAKERRQQEYRERTRAAVATGSMLPVRHPEGGGSDRVEV